MRWKIALAAFAALFLLCDLALAQQALVLQGATVHTAAGPPIENAVILIEAGKITAVGAGIEVPPQAESVDLSGKTVIPGMMDNHSHIAVVDSYFEWQDANEFPQPVGPEFRIIDALRLDDPAWEDSLRHGVTTLIVSSGSGEAISGQGVVMKTFGGNDLQSRILKEQGGMKFAMGRKGYGRQNRYPGTAMGTATIMRETLIKAQEYRRTWDEYESGDKAGPPPKRDLGMEAMADILRGKNRVRAHVHSATDILSLLRLKDEFGFDLTLHHSTEAYKVADEIAARGVGAVVLPLFVQVGLSEDVLRGPAVLNRAGVKVAMHTDHPVSQQRWLRYCAALSMRYGLPEDVALKSITLHPAQLAWVDDRVGSIEAGKDADLVVLDGPWYEISSRVEAVYVNGLPAYRASGEEEE